MADISLEKVRCIYPGGVVAVEGLDLHLEPGRLTVLVGPSGCGKTTTLRLIAGLESPDDGAIRFDGALVNDWPPARRNVAMVFQDPALYPHLTVRENLRFGLRLRRHATDPIRRFGFGWRCGANRRIDRRNALRVERVLRLLRIESLADRTPDRLSGGQRQRVALGRAFVHRPAAFLLDEPLTGLDARLRVELREELQFLLRRLRTTTLLVTHDQADALALGDRVAVMHERAIRQIGTPEEIYRRPADRFVAGFIGARAMNFWTGLLIPPADGSSAWRFQFGRRSLALPAAWRESLNRYGGREAVLGVRPEDARPTDEAAEGVVSTRVDTIEFLGDSTLLYCRSLDPGDRESFRAVAPEREFFHVGQVVHFRFREDRLHLFDPADGSRIVADAENDH